VADRLVVVDASPLIALAAADASHLLRHLFVRVTVTRSVHDEVMAGAPRPGSVELERAIAEGWIDVSPDPAGAALFPELGPGEATTVALADAHLGPTLVLMDDPLGRARARSLGLDVSGVAAILLAAKRAGAIDAVKPSLARLVGSGFRMSEDLIAGLLDAADEA
jgi:predicted nucleic acid-binding protein